MTRTRYLRRNHACQQWSNLIFWDTETQGETYQNDENKQLHKLRLGVARSCRREGGKGTRRKTLHYKDNKTFWEWVFEHLDLKRPIYMMAHNVGFDLTISGFWRLLDDGVLVLSTTEPSTDPKTGEPTIKTWSGCFCDNDPPTIIAVKHAATGCKITIVDSLNYYRHSLKSIGDKLGVPKLPMPEFSASDSEWFTYCEQDVIVLEQAMMTLMDWFADNDYGNFRFTQASLSMGAFRHRFYDHPIILNSSPAFDEIEKESYFGGRLEMMVKGERSGTTHQVDVVSQYPAVMRNNVFPVERLSHSASSVRVLGPSDMGVEFIADVRVKTLESRYPLRMPKMGTVYPVGEFRTTLCGPELLQAKKRGDILEVYSWAKYRLEPVFRKFVNHFYDRRLAAKDRGDEQESYFLKILMNSLYGKFGQRDPEWKDLGSIEKLPSWVQAELEENEYNATVRGEIPNAPQFFIHAIAGKRKTVKYRTIAKHAQISQERKPHRNAFCAISGFVTSYARVQMDKLITLAGRENVYYVVTDAMFVSDSGFERLRVGGKLDPRRLGYLSEDLRGSNFRVDALHHYRLSDKRKFGSRKSSARLVCTTCNQPFPDGTEFCPDHPNGSNECKTIETKFEGIRGVLRRKSQSGVVVSNGYKTYKREYNRGTVGDDGRINPLVFTTVKDRNVNLTRTHETEKTEYVT